MKFALKIGSFFCKVIGYKNENLRSNRGLKNFLKKIIVKIYLGIYLELLQAVWSQSSFR